VTPIFKELVSMKEAESYIERLQRLASNNKKLKTQIEELTSRFSTIEEQNRNYQKLLHQFNPEPDMATGKDRRKTTRRLRMVSVLYVGISGFDKLYQCEHPERMIDLLDELRIQLDKIAFEHNIVRIKSLGDSMLFATGLQGETRTNAIDITEVALKMQHMANTLTTNDSRIIWQTRLAIHTGSVLAVPESKENPVFSFSGDNLKMAVRLGEATPPCSITASVMTYELIKEFFEGKHIGQMPFKYIGNLNIYQIQGWVSELQCDKNNYKANSSYKVKYGHLKFMDLQEEVLDYLEKNLPQKLFYHNIKHTIDVITEVELIGWSEGVSEEEILLLKLAALFHDAGHTINYVDHEYHSTVMAREKILSYDFPVEYIDTVNRLIMATQMPPQPKDILEKIMCDSDLDYLGRTDFIPVSNTLYQELKERNMVGSLNDWNKRQLRFIKEHHYFTKTAARLREVNKQNQIERLKKIIE
jgi:class 3 adenylate cyclase